MFFIATEEKLILCWPFNQIISWLPSLAVARCSGSVPLLCLDLGCVCACSTLSASATNSLPSADQQHGKKEINQCRNQEDSAANGC